jgi:glucose/arabinose dehydrogenase/PKD repeat protein
MRQSHALTLAIAAAVALPGLTASVAADAAPLVLAAAVPYPGLTATPVLTGLNVPVAFRFAPDGRIYVASKRGDVRLFDGPGDTTPTTALDLRGDTYDHGDRGLLGLALDPAFATGRPYLYVLHTYDRDPFGSATVPRWGNATGGDPCPSPPGGNADGCTATARLLRYTVRADGTADPASRVLLLDGANTTTGGWCQQFPSHTIGMVEFGRDGALYVGAGDGASFTAVDWGQLGGTSSNPGITPANPCADRPGGRGTALAAATSRGGALRAQAVRAAPATGYVSWDGAILRVNPDTGAPAAGNPLLTNGIAGDDRIIAYGLRNPYRFAFRPGTDQLWLGDVGWGTYEEVNTFTAGAGQASVPNFGWPCVEGPNRQSRYDAAGVGLCESLYASPDQSLGGVPSPLVGPYYAWPRTGAQPAPGCATEGGGAATGGRFVTSTTWPAALRGGYVFADYARGCVVALPLTDGRPDVARRVALVTGSPAVFLDGGPGGDLYWLDIAEGSLNRLRSAAANVPPVARFTATPSSGPLPLTVMFDGSATTDANAGEVIGYAWDLDGDGACDDATGVRTARTYTAAGAVDVRLCASDQLGETGTTTRTIRPGNSPPVIGTLTSSADAAGWRVGDVVTLTAAATDESGTLPESAFTWSVLVRHCGSPTSEADCHTHPLAAIPPGRTTSLTTPDHDFFAYLRVVLTVTDPGGATSTRTLDVRPRTSAVELRTEPAGLAVSVGASSGPSPRTGQFLEGGLAQLLAPAAVTVGATTYRFTGWADGATAGPQRTVAAPAGSSAFTARYAGAPNTAPAVSGVTAVPASLATGPGTAFVTVTARVTDDAGAASVQASLRDPAGRVRTAVMTRTAGTATDGTWSGRVPVPYGSPAGAYAASVSATDAAPVTGTASGPVVQVRARTCVLWWCNP